MSRPVYGRGGFLNPTKMNIQEQKNITTAEINREIVEYDLCSGSRSAYSEIEHGGQFVYLGTGVIWSFNGTPQTSQRINHFWKKA